ncbi:MAG: hypothetical protein P8173_14905 [Gammaproteobacteria bacterium]
MNSLFFDILGALIGLVTVLLLLSMVVTALVQATQALLRLRGRNLLYGLAGILQEQADLSSETAKEKAREILTANGAPMLRGKIDPLGFIGKWLGPQTSWLSMEELRTILDDCTVDVEVNVRDKIVNRFENIQKVMSKRFLRTMRLWTIAWALPVAFYFQISAPAVLTNFLNDAELQARAVQMATDLQGQAQATLGRQPTYEDGSAKALRRLIEKHPKYRVVFKEASKGEEDKGDIVANLAQALKDDPHGQELIAEYRQLLDEQYRIMIDQARKNANMAGQSLAKLNIDPWRKGWGFYVHAGQLRWSNCTGVFMTLILLSFGAPFWFNLLRYLMNLRDVLKPPEQG